MQYVENASEDPTGPSRAERVVMRRVFYRGLSEPQVARMLVEVVMGAMPPDREERFEEVMREERERMKVERVGDSGSGGEP